MFDALKKSLSQTTLTARIILSMIAMIAVVGITYCFAIYYGIHLAEETLIGQRMKERIELAVAWKKPEEVKVADYFVIFSSNPKESGGFETVPAEYMKLEDGFQEVLSAGEDYFLYKYTDPKTGTVWVMLQDQAGFEAKEIDLFIQAGIGLLAALLLAGVFGLWLAHGVTKPFKSLAADVKEMAEATAFKPLKERPAADEVGELALTVEKTLKKFDAALQREKAFSADVSHEFRTPLMVISSSLDVLKLPQITEDERKKELTNIDVASKRLNRLIHVFMALARDKEIAGAEVKLLKDLLQEAIGIWEEQAKDKGLRILFEDYAAKKTLLNASFALSVADNLVRNAVQYTKEGTITVRLYDTYFEVADTGVGIKEEEKESVLKRFVRGESAKGEGYGLGLSLIKRICDHEKWSVAFRANAPQGTVFTINLESGQKEELS